MNNRRMGGGGGAPRFASDQNSLHRCAIALCSNPAVAEGVCEMHHSSSRAVSNNGSGNNEVVSRSGYMGSGSYMSSSPSSAGYPDDMGGDRYRAVSNLAMQPQGRATKKQKPNPDSGRGGGMMGHGGADYGSGTPGRGGGNKQYQTLTQESLNQMANRMKYSKGPTAMSAYDENPYLQRNRPGQGPSTGSIQSDGSEHSGDAETNLRRERNRIAARKSRQRKLDRISNLEEEKMRLEQHRDMLVQEIRSLEKKDSGIASNAVMTITDKEYSTLQNVRIQIIKAVEDAYNSGDIFATMKYLRDDSIVSGPQNSSVHLRGKDSLVLDYLCTTYLFRDVQLHHIKVDSGGPRSQHFRVHWVFSGVVKSAGVSMNKEFLELIESVKGKRVKIEGVSNFSFSGDKIVYVHRTADQAKFLSALVNLSKE